MNRIRGAFRAIADFRRLYRDYGVKEMVELREAKAAVDEATRRAREDPDPERDALLATLRELRQASAQLVDKVSEDEQKRHDAQHKADEQLQRTMAALDRAIKGK
mmetsp:Transcript_7452/g.23824  ORF Transcript_7452/g.23824 Transcript_7452/m.23824 type:complete len:105 (-) Transcript_7452:3007-3321(-)